MATAKVTEERVSDSAARLGERGKASDEELQESVTTTEGADGREFEEKVVDRIEHCSDMVQRQIKNEMCRCFEH